MVEATCKKLKEQNTKNTIKWHRFVIHLLLCLSLNVKLYLQCHMVGHFEPIHIEEANLLVVCKNTFGSWQKWTTKVAIALYTA